MKTWRLLTALPFLASGLFAAIPAAIEQTMPERLLPQLDLILKSAVQQSPRMLNRALDLEIAENSRIQARANLLPTLSANASFLESSDHNKNVGPGSSTNLTYSVTKTPYAVALTQPLFHWGERRNNDRIGEIQLRMSQGQFRDGYHLLGQELRAAYLRLVVHKTMAKRARFYLDYTNTQLKQQEDRLAKKVISEVEIFTARLASEQAQIALERTEADFESAKQSFARLAGGVALNNEEIPDAIPATVYAPEAFAQLAADFLAQKDPPTTEAFSLRKQLEIANLTYANQKTRLRPKVNAMIGLSQDEQNNLYGTGNRYALTSLYAGISVNWMIFDGFSSGAAVRSSLAQRHQLENDYRQLTERLAQDAQNQVKQINFSARNMSISDRLLNNSEGYLRAIQEDFRRGVRSEADVSQAQLALFDSQITAANARTDYLVRIGDFLGTVMEDPILANLAEK